MRLPPFKSILALEVVARLGSISKAAEELNLTVSAVSHQITNLETFVGCTLFERSHSGLRLTPAGARFQREISGALDVIANAAQQARSAETVEVLRLHSSPSFASVWLMPRLSAFRALHPDIRVQLSSSHLESDFTRAEIDVDIRYGLAHWPSLHVESLFPEEIIPLISPALKSNLSIETPEDLLKEDLIFSDVNIVQWPRWFAAHGVPNTPSRYALSFDRAYMVIEAAVQGLGIALDSSKMAEGAIKRGELVPVFPDRKPITVHAHHIVYPKQHSQWPRVVRFTEWLKNEARQG
ncbi:LysR family transcriptional regulator [Orrella sp. NBD-18]|uniref:LysR family transcriptional regulator n=1 Tax=Sheuella amnicola TaxID=2707330 RepID=A0A6B2R2M3_9BURK|nr:LysR substrate-binding domain-containing protein [Sheuella amnicola]NDY84318.1 LysR family transcriptional regulator [Sheuella amnicola]